jgi:hypothetical protein
VLRRDLNDRGLLGAGDDDELAAGAQGARGLRHPPVRELLVLGGVHVDVPGHDATVAVQAREPFGFGAVVAAQPPWRVGHHDVGRLGQRSQRPDRVLDAQLEVCDAAAAVDEDHPPRPLWCAVDRPARPCDAVTVAASAQLLQRPADTSAPAGVAAVVHLVEASVARDVDAVFHEGVELLEGVGAGAQRLDDVRFGSQLVRRRWGRHQSTSRSWAGWLAAARPAPSVMSRQRE